MKKFLLFSALSFLFTMGTTAQTLLSEGFEGDVFPPTGWTVIDDTQAATIHHWVVDTTSAIAGEYSAFCDAGSWLDDPEPIKEEWLITPELELTDNSHGKGLRLLLLQTSTILPLEYLPMVVLTGTKFGRL